MSKKIVARLIVHGRKHPNRRCLVIGCVAIVLLWSCVLRAIGCFIRRVPWQLKTCIVACACFAFVLVLNRGGVFQLSDTPFVQEEPQILESTVLPVKKEALNDRLKKEDFLVVEREYSEEDTNENYEERVKIPKEELPWYLTLVNFENPVLDTYEFELVQVCDNFTIDARIYDDFSNLLEAGEKEGLSLLLCSGYRSYERQVELFEEQCKYNQKQGMSQEEAYEAAAFGFSLPGTSEHQIGIAVDIVALYAQRLEVGFADLPEGKWLKDNSYKYGFILRYPEGKEDVTQIRYEPWHFRYVGIEAAKEIYESDLVLEEYLELITE